MNRIETGRVHQWAVSDDTGASSKTIWCALLGVPVTVPSVPRDPQDFGRCYRLLQLNPPWRRRLPEVAVLYPGWSPFVREWPRLTRMYTRALRRGQKNARAMYLLMRELIAEGDNEKPREPYS